MSGCITSGARDTALIVQAGPGPYDWDANDATKPKRYMVTGAPISADPQEIVSQRLNGSYDMATNDINYGNVPVEGSIRLEPGIEELTHWLPRILNDAAETVSGAQVFESGTDFGIGVSQFGVLQKIGPLYMEYQGGEVNVATFEADSGGILKLDMQCIFRGYEDVSANAAALDSAIENAELITDNGADAIMMKHGMLTVDSSSREFESFSLNIDKKLVGRHFASEFANCIAPSDLREFTLTTNNPYNANIEAIRKTLKNGLTGVILFDLGDGRSVTFTPGRLKAPEKSPAVEGPGDVPFNLDMRVLEHVDNDTPANSLPALSVAVDLTTT